MNNIDYYPLVVEEMKNIYLMNLGCTSIFMKLKCLSLLLSRTRTHVRIDKRDVEK